MPQFQEKIPSHAGSSVCFLPSMVGESGDETMTPQTVPSTANVRRAPMPVSHSLRSQTWQIEHRNSLNKVCKQDMSTCPKNVNLLFKRSECVCHKQCFQVPTLFAWSLLELLRFLETQAHCHHWRLTRACCHRRWPSVFHRFVLSISETVTDNRSSSVFVSSPKAQSTSTPLWEHKRAYSYVRETTTK